MTTTISLFIPRILEEVYAFSALDHSKGLPDCPPLLGRNNEDALRVLVQRAALQVLIKLPVSVSSYTFTDERIEFELRLPSGFGSAALLHADLESAVAGLVLASCYTGIGGDYQAVYSEMAGRKIESLRGYLSYFPEALRRPQAM